RRRGERRLGSDWSSDVCSCDLVGGDDWFAPLVWRLGEQLNRRRAQRATALGCCRDATLAGDVRAEDHMPSVNANREISGTNRTEIGRASCREREQLQWGRGSAK